MIITISAVNYDPQGFRVCQDSTKTITAGVNRRVERVPTLDNGVVIFDFGFVAGDGSLNVQLAHTEPKETKDFLIRLQRLHSLVRVCSSQGAYIGAMQDLRTNTSPISFSLLIKR